MQKTQDKTAIIFIAIIVIIVGVCTYFYYTQASKKPEPKLPVPCSKGDTYNIMTGKLCPGATPVAPAATPTATTSSSTTNN
jgi:hypothetical protein